MFDLKGNMEILGPEKVNKVLRRDGHEAALWIFGWTRMATVLEHREMKICFHST